MYAISTLNLARVSGRQFMPGCACAGGGAAVRAAMTSTGRPRTQEASTGTMSPVDTEDRTLKTQPRM